ncbi:hypothetical protein MX715_002692 [Vibrio parahaemolyticus]|uniref:hypothetical protein n=1 Tax=Vibrio parahaemolyticus TaxID=670 RepID=UPI0006A5A54D|nr:hypothetical protein [Vibrio parahaemolyticus]EGQ8947315.1 hypothetical protein [Vibrio parahaemolyticus]EGR1599143.1 hypothetical protein [Vibrio parahaemolyticus]EGR1762944.1 hypothetical protein [Vibrio parahaemolyticus]EGR3004280.1 hypothetical protein [Vibrio parahaemolyticus]EGR3145559.1 hypothetical protein [Vibrio parahaemolyticus]
MDIMRTLFKLNLRDSKTDIVADYSVSNKLRESIREHTQASCSYCDLKADFGSESTRLEHFRPKKTYKLSDYEDDLEVTSHKIDKLLDVKITMVLDEIQKKKIS